jgi:hypothetical protein
VNWLVDNLTCILDCQNHTDGIKSDKVYKL